MKWFFPLAATLVASAPPAMAVGNAALDNGKQRSNVTATREGFRFGECLANYNSEATERLLQTEPGTPEEMSAYNALIPREEHRCVQLTSGDGRARLSVPIDLLRGYLAQTRYLTLNSDGAPPSIAQAQYGEINQQILINRLAGATDRPAELVRVFSDCVVAAGPMNVDALVRTDVNSRNERETMGRLSTAFGPCLWQGQSIEFSREMLRSSLADALYRMAQGRTEVGTMMTGESE